MDHDKVAVQVDETMLESFAKMRAASQQAMLSRIKRSPEDHARIQAILEASIQRQAEFESELGAVLDNFRQGTVDPNYDSVEAHRESAAA